MRHLTKGSEPEVITNFKRASGTQYNDLKKAEIQKQLLQEQKGLCAYCMCRIDTIVNRSPKMIIEHIKCREDYPDLQLEYSNMLGVCLGGSDYSKMELHCDKSKDRGGVHLELKKLNPLNSNVESMLDFLVSGVVKATDDDEDVKSDIETLNLNEQFTIINREKILRHLKDGYKRVWRPRNKTSVRQFLNRNISKWSQCNKEGYLQPYNLIAIKFLEKKLSRLDNR